MRSYTLTLTSANTVYKLDTLLRAANTKERGMFASISILADSANANPILVGGATLSATVFAHSLAANATLEVGRAEFNTISTLGIYVYGVTTAGMKIHVALHER